MKLQILSIGRARGDPTQATFAHFAERLRGRLELREFELRKSLPPDAQPAAESELLLQAIPSGAATIALDGSGRALSSEQFAERLTGWADQGRPAAAFLIGGGYGLSRDLVTSSDFVLSLGPMTWPHLLVRAMLAEQLYRADCIQRGHPYHHGATPR